MFSNSPEYCTLISCTSELTTAIKPHILQISEVLLQVGFISEENLSNFSNQAVPVSNRASELLSNVRSKVQLNPGNFHCFIDILLKWPLQYKDVLVILDRNYIDRGGAKETGISAALAAFNQSDKVARHPIQPAKPKSCESTLSFHSDMSDSEFEQWLVSEGMTQSVDRAKIIHEGINAKALPHLTEDEVKAFIESQKLTLGGKGIFRKLWRENCVKVTTEENASYSLLDEELNLKSRMHFKISSFLEDIPAHDIGRLGGSLGIAHFKLSRMTDVMLVENFVSAWLRREDEVLQVGKPTLRTLAMHLKRIGQCGKADDILSSNGSCVDTL